jgi:hypothetical protein
MRARPAGPDESSALLLFARSGPTKEAHRRALYRSDGLLRSVAGQGHGRLLPVTLPRERSEQAKHTEAGDHRSPTPKGTIRGGIRAGMREGASVHYHGADHPLLATPVSLTVEHRHLQVAICRKAAGVPPGNDYCGTVPAGPTGRQDGPADPR